jgi:hypothetical protein
MNLLCIKDGKWKLVDKGAISACGFPEYGEFYTSSHSVDKFYFIDECDGFFDKKGFIPISESNETELVNTKEGSYA